MMPAPPEVWTVVHMQGSSGATCGCLIALLNASAYLIESHSLVQSPLHIKE